MKAPVPAKLPHLHTIIQNLGQPVDALAKFLDISPQTMRRYIREGQAPRPVMLALYWETDWGRSAVACDAVNWGRMLHMQNMALQSQVKTLKQRIAKLEKALADVDKAANMPFYEAR
ncbi:hypothetical protein [Comamonas kerstersii]